MTRHTTTYVLHDEPLRITYSYAPYVPAVMYGDAPEPAQDAEVDVLAVATWQGVPVVLTEDEETALRDWLLAEHDAGPDPDEMRERRHERMREDWA